MTESQSPRPASQWISIAGGPGPRLQATAVRASVLRCHTMADGLEWLSDDGVVLSLVDLERIFEDLRALIAGSGELDPTGAFAVDIAVMISEAIERQQGDH